MTAIAGALSRQLRGPGVSRMLSKFSIDAKRYWLLTDLFAQIAGRGEMLDQLGLDGDALGLWSKIYLVLSAAFTLFLVLGKTGWTVYFTFFLFFTAFLLMSLLLSEAGNSLVNPTEGMALAHHPINGATYTAAKLSHLARIILYMVPAFNLVPAFVGLMLPDTNWAYPLLHLAAAFGIGLVSALACCALFGWLVRFVPARRLKAAAQIVSVLPLVTMFGLGRIGKLVARLHLERWLPTQPAARWSLAAGALVLILAAAVLGLRSLSSDYLLRVPNLMRGGASAGSSSRRSLVGALVARFFGGQGARAGFQFVSRMMLRDWQFRRQFIGILPMILIGLTAMIKGGAPPDPFLPDFSPSHLFPHILGMMLFVICLALPYGTDYKGAWIFLLTPSRSLEAFSRGIYGTLLIACVVIPHLLILPLFVYRWGWFHAALFLAYSLVIASGLLSLNLRLLEVIPFTKQIDPSRGAFLLPVMIAGTLLIGIVVALQHFIIFRSVPLVAGTIVAAAIATYFLTRSTLSHLAISIRYHLGLVSAESGTLYQEVNA